MGPELAGRAAADQPAEPSSDTQSQAAAHGSARIGAGEPTPGPSPASAASPTAAAGTPRSTNMTQLESLVSRGLSASLAQRGGTLTMRLLPDSLGAMRIQMDVQQGVVRVSMDVANAQAHRLLTDSLDTLRASLEARGLSVEKLGVTLTPSGHAAAASLGAGANAGGSNSPGTGDPNSQRQDANGQFSQHDAGDGRSRSWLGGDQRNQERPGGAGPHASIGTNAKDESFGDLWQRLRVGVDATV